MTELTGRRGEPPPGSGADQRPEAWSERLEELHEESSRSHSVDVWTRQAMVEHLPALGETSTVLDVGCSTGHLLFDLRQRHPSARLLGADIVMSGLRKARRSVPRTHIVRADARFLPLADDSVDAVVSANLLEHVADDVSALAEFRRVLRPGGTAVIVVPAAPGTYDYYDRFLHHQRRYRRGELAAKARSQGFVVLQDMHLCSLVFPAFWLVKKRNRWLHDDLTGEALASRVEADIAATHDSLLFSWACRSERWLVHHRLRLPFGIRGLTVVQRPLDNHGER
jgi:SAM-dependent methyltransferase